MKRLITLLFAALLPMAAAVGQSQVALPDMGTSTGQILPERKAKELGEQAYRQIRQQARVLDDPQVNEFLDDLGYQLVSHSNEPGKKYTFFVIADDTVNAFAMPGGYIGVHSALITTTERESELAAVVAHEIAHVTQKHIARIIEDSQRLSVPTMLATLGVILASGGNPDVSQAAIIGGQAALIQRQINFTRAHEAEADRIGINTLARSGFDPEAMADFFGRMERVNLAYGRDTSEFLRTHPVTSDRIAEAKNRAHDMSVTPNPHDRREYLDFRERVRALATDTPAEAEDFYQATLPTVQDEDVRDAMHYGRAVTLLRLEKPDQAAKALRELIERNGEQLDYELALAQAELDAGQQGKALDRYASLQDAHGPRFPIVVARARALMDSHEPAQAEQLLRPVVASHSDDAQLQRLYAHAADDAGAKADARIAIAEAYYLEGRTHDALQQLKQGQHNPAINATERARLEARYHEMWDRLSEDEQKKLKDKFPDLG